MSRHQVNECGLHGFECMIGETSQGGGCVDLGGNREGRSKRVTLSSVWSSPKL